MSAYAIGDLQGCLEPLQRLLEKIQFDPKQDHLWFAGDLINRGPQSLETLRFLRSMAPAVTAVLGNHDLHFLAVAMGHQSCKRADTLDELLSAPDRDELVAWLRQLPLLHHDAELNFVMTHAGLPPQWRREQAAVLANEVEMVIQDDERCHAFFAAMYGNEPATWRDDLSGTDRLRAITNALTRMRFCQADGTLELKTKQSITEAPEGFAPWFSHPQRQTKDERILFGHWAALEGQTDTDNVFALDTGCVWGGPLSALRLEDQQWFQVQPN